MKKIVFSFDDGLLDFYENTFPILKKYNIKATFNIATGFVDKTYNDGFKYCTVEQLKELSDYGIELAIHPDAHALNTSVEDLSISLKKLSSWIGKEKIHGIVIPYNVHPTEEIMIWGKQQDLSYLRTEDIYNPNKFTEMLVKLHIIKYGRAYIEHNQKIFRNKTKVALLSSFSIFRNKTVEDYIKLVSKMRNGTSLTLMFHSLFNSDSECDNCPYPNGAWTTDKFEELIKWLIDHKYKIVTQYEAVEK